MPFASESEAHAEWHLNAGVPMGTAGCPQDACHPVEDYEPEPGPGEGVRCGNCKGRHWTVADVKVCYATPHLSQVEQMAVAAELDAKAAEQAAEQTERARRSALREQAVRPPSFAEFAEAHEWWDGELSSEEQQAAYKAHLDDLALSLHDIPCVCGPYDRCSGVRFKNARDSGNWRDRFRSYDD